MRQPKNSYFEALDKAWNVRRGLELWFMCAVVYGCTVYTYLEVEYSSGYNSLILY